MNNIFKTYTGNAMLNNALMTVEALTGLDSVSQITPFLLLDLYQKSDLREVNRRLKNYTMLFTKNGPLHNDKNNGDKIYEALFTTIINNFENDGEYTCEISGLKFQNTFQQVYEKALESIGMTAKEIKNKDTNIGRTWFPLIGGLGSDAQALPQAKFMVNIHPVCIAILQFLPLSSLLYKGGVLLIDSSNFQLAKRMVAENAKILAERIESISSNEKIENVKDLSKGDYLIRVLDILTEKEEMEESYSDLNLWSFSNSGTGASCEIDRVPNSLIRKLKQFRSNPKTSLELKSILSNRENSSSFIECLDDNKDWYRLYPAVFGTGKKKEEHNGYSEDFLETYYSVINNKTSIDYAKYISGLINKFKSADFNKLLLKTDAWDAPEFRIELFKVFILASENGHWDLKHHITILDDNEQLPIKNQFYKFQKLIHFFYQKKVFSNELPLLADIDNKLIKAVVWMINIIKQDENKNRIIDELKSPNQNLTVSFDNLFFRSLEKNKIQIEDIIQVLYTSDYKQSKFGLNEILRLYFSQKNQEDLGIETFNFEIENKELINIWTQNLNLFAEDYFNYYSEKFSHRDTGEAPLKKYSTLINSLISERTKFKVLLNELIDNTNSYLIEKKLEEFEKWSIEDLLINPLGIDDYSFGSFSLKFLFKQHSINLLNNQNI